VSDQGHTPPALPQGKTRYPFYRRLGGPQGRSGHVRNISAPHIIIIIILIFIVEKSFNNFRVKAMYNIAGTCRSRKIMANWDRRQSYKDGQLSSLYRKTPRSKTGQLCSLYRKTPRNKYEIYFVNRKVKVLLLITSRTTHTTTTDATITLTMHKSIFHNVTFSTLLLQNPPNTMS